LQTELSTYCTEPTDLEDFATWKQQFKVSNITDDISRVLASNDKIREIHTKLVPVAVSYTDFWERYFYKLNKLNQEEERRAALVKRATTSEQVDEENLSWDDEESAANAKGDVAKKEDVEDYFQKIDSNEDKGKEKGVKSNNKDETVTEPRVVEIIEPIATPVESHVVPTSPTPSPASPTSPLRSPSVEESKKESEKKEVKIEKGEWDNWE